MNEYGFNIENTVITSKSLYNLPCGELDAEKHICLLCLSDSVKSYHLACGKNETY